MKFAKELERDAVPEWRIKYFNYKAGKKYVKAVARALNRTPRNIGQLTPSYFTAQTLRSTQDGSTYVGDGSETRTWAPTVWSDEASTVTRARPVEVPRKKGQDSIPGDDSNLQYGSFVPTPKDTSPLALVDSKKSGFELPEPALASPSAEAPRLKKNLRLSSRSDEPFKVVSRSVSTPGLPKAFKHTESMPPTVQRRPNEGKPLGQSPSHLRRLLSYSGGLGARDQSRGDVSLQGIDLVHEREGQFYDFMDSELHKVETFYKMKEEQAGQRLTLLREQLHEMRNRRIQELADEHRRERSHTRGSDSDRSQDKPTGWVQPIKNKIFPPGPNSRAFTSMPRTPLLATRRENDAERDYIRRPENQDVSYRTAKRKLKLALQEFYRGLELLKSYALLNRTAFRKINKKYDKAANARPTYRYVNEKVNKAWFVNSDVLDGHIKTVEDLYARYFERGNHKLAVGKLRSLSKKSRDESGSSFLNGFLLGTGLVFAVQGLVYAGDLLFSDDPVLRVQTSYLLQLYGGYFLMLVLFSLFCINCFIWTRNKINYPFIFEFDQRRLIDWRQLAEFPSFFFLLFGIFMWINFSRYGTAAMFLYLPVALIGITVLIILLPFPVLAHSSRKWLAYSHWRLLLAGIYPVEFRDFFLGDIYCSLTYAMANIELFFCLYSHDWNNPPQCNSNHSRLLGFLTTLPGIWRAFQCLRRYKDTRNIFPHLVNCGKYAMTILSYVTLSLYRIDNTTENFALFITFSIINGVYCSIWDLFMDFSLLQADSRHFALRDILALKRRWPYYTIMVVDPILRFAWIFYAIFTHDAQHSTIVSFLVSLLEVIRRGMWTCFRVENEHCANVSQYKASRDVPLPYRIEPLMDRASAESTPVIRPGSSEDAQQQQTKAQRNGKQQARPSSSHRPEQAPAQPEQDPEGLTTSSSTAVGSTLGTLRRRAETISARSFSKILASAHKQDFQKRRKPVDEALETEHGVEHSDDDEDDEDDYDDQDMSADMREAQDLRRGHSGS